MAPHIATVPETQSSRTMTRVDLDQTTAMQPYAHRNLFENEKSLIDRMVATLKQLLEHVRPYGPDELDYVPFTEFNGFDDILYDVYFQGILDITQDDAITSRNQSDQRRIMHTRPRRFQMASGTYGTSHLTRRIRRVVHQENETLWSPVQT